MIETLLLMGATGDLAGRYLLPALAALRAAGELPEGFRVIGTGREQLDLDEFRRGVADRLEQHAGDVPAAAREALMRSLEYRQLDFDDPEGAAPVMSDSRPIAAYLALPPAAFAPAITALDAAGLPRGSRIVVEKPFGDDLDSAIALNALLTEVGGDAVEEMFFRVDHVLGMATVQNLIGLRFANRVLEPLWNSTHIEEIEILWEETLALEGRAGYYDGAGALKDVMQNHMLQVLSLVTMEPPLSFDERDLRDRKVEALRSVRALVPADAAGRTRRARYTAGRLSGTGEAMARDVPDYASEDGVDPARGTETFAEMTLELDSPRWTGTRFVLRAGKALAERRKEVGVRFRPASHMPYAAGVAANELRIGIDGPEDIALHLTGNVAGPQSQTMPLVLAAPPPASELPAYSRVLLEALHGGSTLSVRGDEAEEAWRVVTPVLEAWAAGLVPLEEYPAGSAGPASRASREAGKAAPAS